MDFKQSTFQEILDSEREMVLRAEERFGPYYVNAFRFTELFSQSINTVPITRLIFALFLSQVRKHQTLALFSTVRLHRTQAKMNLRQALEARAFAAYAIAHIDATDFADKDEEGILNPTQDLAMKRYKWLEQNFAEGSNAIKRLKETINQSSAHSNILDAQSNFNFDGVNRRFDTPFFDFEDVYLIKSDLWLIANVAMGLLRLFFEVNRTLDVVVFADDFEKRLKELGSDNGRLREEMMQTERYQHTNQLIQRRIERKGER
jgi:hypothetical protein